MAGSDDWLWILGIGVAAFAVGSGSSSSSSSGSGSGGGGSVGDGTTTKGKLWAKLESLPELDETQRHFLMLVAYGESRYKLKALNDSAGEREAARKAYDKNPSLATKLDSCAPRAKWINGSGGLFGRLFPYFGDDMLDVFATCIGPDAVFDMDHAIVSALKNARSLQSHDAFKDKPTVGTLRLGWWGPGKMKPPQDAERLAKYRRHAKEYGGPDGLVEMQLGPFPAIASLRGIFERLRNAKPAEPVAPPAGAGLVGPFRAGADTVAAGGPDRVTTDQGWHTVEFWRYGDMWIRIDDRTADSRKLRWVVMHANGHIFAFEAGHVASAAQFNAGDYRHVAVDATQWIDTFKG